MFEYSIVVLGPTLPMHIPQIMNRQYLDEHLAVSLKTGVPSDTQNSFFPTVQFVRRTIALSRCCHSIFTKPVFGQQQEGNYTIRQRWVDYRIHKAYITLPRDHLLTRFEQEMACPNTPNVRFPVPPVRLLNSWVFPWVVRMLLPFPTIISCLSRAKTLRFRQCRTA